VLLRFGCNYCDVSFSVLVVVNHPDFFFFLFHFLFLFLSILTNLFIYSFYDKEYPLRPSLVMSAVLSLIVIICETFMK